MGSVQHNSHVYCSPTQTDISRPGSERFIPDDAYLTKQSSAVCCRVAELCLLATSCSYSVPLNMKAAGSSETLVNFYHITQQHMSEGSVFFRVTAATISNCGSEGGTLNAGPTVSLADRANIFMATARRSDSPPLPVLRHVIPPSFKRFYDH